MPASLTHLLTGQAALPYLNPENLSLYWLGCVVPDSVNLAGFATKEIRWRCHLRDKDLNQWMKNLLRFLRDNKGSGDRSYLLGYAVHVAGDLVWDEQFEKRLREAICGKELSPEERFSRRWQEHYRFEQEQLSADWWLRIVKPQLAQANPWEINGIPPAQAVQYRNYLVEEYAPTCKEETVGFVTRELVEIFGGALTKKLCDYRIAKPLGSR